MEMESLSLRGAAGLSWRRIFSGTLMIAGTTIGAGMLGIPLLTAQSGFMPAVGITVLVWLFMLATGLLFLEVALWMPKGANILSMAERFLGRKGKIAAGGLFLFLYSCLMIAYFAGGSPLLSNFIGATLGVSLIGWKSTLFFALLFGTIVAFGAKWIDRVNVILTVSMFAAYALLLGTGSSEVSVGLLSFTNWGSVLFAVPVLFSAFGYHNVIPSLCTYLERDRKALRLSIFMGTGIALAIYLLWQWLIIGSIPKEAIASAMAAGVPATAALQSVTGKPWVFLIGQYFAFFALVTSMLGVAFSMVDFIGDGLKMAQRKGRQLILTFLTFLPPFVCTTINPGIFDRALGVAGGIGEAILNGVLPVVLVWLGRYRFKLDSEEALPGGRPVLLSLLSFGLLIFGLEALILLN